MALQCGNFWRAIRPKVVRHWRAFAEEEVVLPTGPRAGTKFSIEFMPWTGLVLDEFERGLFDQFWASGPGQSGKTTLFFHVPLVYHLFEIEEPVIIGVPIMDMAQGIWEEKILPAVEATRYRELLPRRGQGSRGGDFTFARFGNGVTLRFMAAGGGDQQRSSHTARVAILTEVDKMDVAGLASRETDPVSQIIARTRAFGELTGRRARIYAECTMSTEQGRIHQEVVENGTDTRPRFSCPRCSRWVALERGGLVGWQGAQDELAARAAAAFLCPSCGASWTEADRAAALRRPLLVAKGQDVGPAGELVGELPRTRKFGFRWNALAAPLRSMAEISAEEWEAEKTGDPQRRKALDQFTWAVPFKDEQLVDHSGISRERILAKIVGHARGVAPDGTVRITAAIDVGLYWCWWMAVAWRADAQGHVIDYGAIEVPHRDQVSKAAILTALREFRDNTLKPGWSCAGATRPPDLTLIDSGYEKDVVYAFVKESGGTRFLPCKGRGSRRDQAAWRAPIQSSDSREVGHEWVVVVQPDGVRLVELHSDHWKREVHGGFAAAPGVPGSITLFHAAPHDHNGLSWQITAEREEEIFEPGKGRRRYWNVVRRQNHYLDVASYARAGADIVGIRTVRPQPPESQPKVPAWPQQLRRFRAQF